MRSVSVFERLHRQTPADCSKAGVVIDLLILVGLVIATWVLRPEVA